MIERRTLAFDFATMSFSTRSISFCHRKPRSSPGSFANAPQNGENDARAGTQIEIAGK